MTNETQSRKEARKTTEALAAANLMTVNSAGILALSRASEAIAHSAASLSGELMSFANRRLREDIETGQSFMDNTNDLAEVLKLECKYAGSTMQDYFSEAAKIMNLAAETSRDVWSPMEDFYKTAVGTFTRR